MKAVAFIGLGVMGLPMSKNLVARGLDVLGCDIAGPSRDALVAAGGRATAPEALSFDGCEAVITMLPEGAHVLDVYESTVFPLATPDMVLIDCSTIDVETTRSLATEAAAKGLAMIDAPVSGGHAAAGIGQLSFMIGGDDGAVARARPLLEEMGTKLQHFGASGAGQAAKACHNMICGITAMAVCEGYALSQALGLDAKQFHALCKGAAAQSWTLENRCPIPGVAANVPSSNDYQPGFAARLMAKDLRLAQTAAKAVGQETPFGAEAAQRFTDFAAGDDGDLDFSAYYRTLRPES
ncbi:MAG: 3-hydroxyisobutyrate dehydrogenase [Pseudomonadota bacterium]